MSYDRQFDLIHHDLNAIFSFSCQLVKNVFRKRIVEVRTNAGFYVSSFKRFSLSKDFHSYRTVPYQKTVPYRLKTKSQKSVKHTTPHRVTVSPPRRFLLREKKSFEREKIFWPIPGSGVESWPQQYKNTRDLRFRCISVVSAKAVTPSCNL